MGLVGGVEASPCYRQLIPDLMLAFDALSLGSRLSRIAKGDAALLGDALADLFHADDRNTDRTRQRDFRAGGWDVGARVPLTRRNGAYMGWPHMRMRILRPNI